jgi:hypothetical protein
MYMSPDSEKVDETLFVGYVPLSMTKNLLEEKGLVSGGYNEL